MIKVLKTTARRYADAPVEPEYMEFGQYFQENAERKTPISWVVLAIHPWNGRFIPDIPHERKGSA